MKQNFSTLRLFFFFIYFISYLKIIPPLYSFRLCVSLYTMFSNAASTHAPSTETRLSPRLSTLFHFGSLSWRHNPPPPPTLSHFLSRPSVGFPLSFPIYRLTHAVAMSVRSRMPFPLRVCGRRLGRLPVSLRDFRDPCPSAPLISRDA